MTRAIKRFFKNKKIEELQQEIRLLKAKLHCLPYEIAERGLPKIPKIIDINETLDCLVNSNMSMSRFGDGEFILAMGTGGINFQTPNLELTNRLREILKSQDENIIVGLPKVFGDLSDYFVCFWFEFREKIYNLLDFDKQYYNSFVSRSYPLALPIDEFDMFFEKMKKIWENKDIVIVEGEASRLGVGNDLFSGAKSIERILCPALNAYDFYEDIFKECQKQPKDKLFIIALGPAATVLSYDLAKSGYRALDMGHVDINYEQYLRKSHQVIAIKNKYVNEAKDGKVITHCSDENYLQSIKAKIGIR